MDTSNPAQLAAAQLRRDLAAMVDLVAETRNLAAARAGAAQAELLADIRTEAQRAANNSQVLVDELMGPAPVPEPAPEEVTDAP